MERIQAAIAKARAERQTQQEQAPSPVSTAAVPEQAPAQAGGVARNWQDIPEVETDVAALEKQRIYVRPSGALGGTFDVLRTRVMQQMVQNNWHRLAITSPTTGCGKTTVTLNLAFGLARQTENRVVLTELDLRRPSMAEVLKLRGSNMQFSRVLSEQEGFAQNACRYGENLAISCNKAKVADPGELLHSSTVARALQTISEEYAPDILLLDMPPLSASDDVLALARHVDAVLIVAAAEETTISQLDNCEKELAEQTNILGVVLNKCRYMENQSEYQYY